MALICVYQFSKTEKFSIKLINYFLIQLKWFALINTLKFATNFAITYDYSRDTFFFANIYPSFCYFYQN